MNAVLEQQLDEKNMRETSWHWAMFLLFLFYDDGESLLRFGASEKHFKLGSFGSISVVPFRLNRNQT